MLKQQCLQCEYRNQWKAQVDEGVSAAVEQHALTGSEDASSGSKEARLESFLRQLTCAQIFLSTAGCLTASINYNFTIHCSL